VFEQRGDRERKYNKKIHDTIQQQQSERGRKKKEKKRHEEQENCLYSLISLRSFG